jgi:hypothetical protein
MNLEEIEWTDLDFQPAETLKGGPPEDWSDLQLRLGHPVVVDARKYFKDAEERDPAIELLKSESDFYYVRYPISVKPTERWGIALLGVKVELENPMGAAEAWSMMPERVDDEEKISVSAKLSPSLKINKTEVSIGSLQAGSEIVVYQPRIYAYNLGTSNPTWEFTPTRGHQVRGIQLLHMVVRQPRKSTTNSNIQVSIELRRSSFVMRLLGLPRGRTEDQVRFSIP